MIPSSLWSRPSTDSDRTTAQADPRTTPTSTSTNIPMPAIYRMTFRHLNCGNIERDSSDPSPHWTCDLQTPTWPQQIPLSSMARLQRLPYDEDGRNTRYQRRWCAGCGEPERVDGIRSIANNTCASFCPSSIYKLLAEYAQAYVDAGSRHNYGRRGYKLWVVNAWIVWAAPLPRRRGPDEERGSCAPPHTVALTREHLVLMHAKGHIDHIHVEFWTERRRGTLEKKIMDLVSGSEVLTRLIHERRPDA